MHTQIIQARIRNAVFAGLIIPALTACGGGEEAGGCHFLEAITTFCLNTALTNALGGGSSTSTGGTSTSTGGGSTSTGGSSGGSTGGNSGGSDNSGGGSSGPGSASVRFYQEFEPNNTLDNANAFNFPTTSGDDHGGIEITGTVQDDTDPSDFIIFTPVRSGSYGIYLCAETCADFQNDDASYLMIYDQSQTTIASTPIGFENEKVLNVDLTGGMAYYVEVNGYNTAQAPHDYKLVVIEWF